MNVANEIPTAPTKSTQIRTATIAVSDLTRIKKELLRAEVRLAKARAAVAGAEVDVKVLSAQLREVGR